jgi:prepilin-type N-terminal cleavage/methylation domain-containing protein/prepilin-type processing-associated H-X9-DG protein
MNTIHENLERPDRATIDDIANSDLGGNRVDLRRQLRTPPAGAFTLIELLVVIAIIAVLAAILTPVMKRVREQADSTKCVSNLRQIGVAINSYASERDGSLPGPLKMGQSPVFEANEQGSLALLLAKYLGIRVDDGDADKSDESDQRANLFVCPSWTRVQAKKSDSPVYSLNDEILPDLNQTPWGDPANNETPLKLAALSTWTKRGSHEGEPVELPRTWALADVDAEMFKVGGSKADFLDKVPQTPVHIDHRNALFFDWHVEPVKLDKWDEMRREAREGQTR